MAPRRNAKEAEGLSPRRTRSGAVGNKREAAAPVARAKKKVRFEQAKGKEQDKDKAKESATGEAAPSSVTVTGHSKSIIIEACKQCNAFKTRALKVKEGLQSALPAIAVSINPLKPRRGCFEIREEGGEIFISLLNMPRPFTPMKKLDMDELIQDIIMKLA